jgi:hypothetical protein
VVERLGGLSNESLEPGLHETLLTRRLEDFLERSPTGRLFPIWPMPRSLTSRATGATRAMVCEGSAVRLAVWQMRGEGPVRVAAGTVLVEHDLEDWIAPVTALSSPSGRNQPAKLRIYTAPPSSSVSSSDFGGTSGGARVEGPERMARGYAPSPAI